MESTDRERPYGKPPAMRLTHTFLLLFFTSILIAQSTPNEQTMARLAGELTAKMNGKKLKKVAILRLTFNDDPSSAEGAWLADEMAFALQAAGPDFAVIPRADIEQKEVNYAARQAQKQSSTSSSSSSDDDYSEEEYTEDEYSEESYDEESYEEASYVEEGETVSTEKSLIEEEPSAETDSKATKKKKNTGLLIGGALLAAGAVALFAGNKKPMAGVRATITGTIVEQGDRLVVTFRAVDKRGRILGMTRGRFVRED